MKRINLYFAFILKAAISMLSACGGGTDNSFTYTGNTDRADITPANATFAAIPRSQKIFHIVFLGSWGLI